MKKTSLFLVVLLWAACSAFAASERYFCIERPLYTSGVLKLSQVDENHVYVDPSDPTYIEELDDWGYPVIGARCYKKWYDPKAEKEAATSGRQFYDARSLLFSNIVAEVNSSGSGVISIYLKSDLDFGGLKADSSACVNDFKPFGLGGSDVPDGVAVFFLGVSGDYETDVHTIKNFCYIADASSGEFRGAGFFSEVSNGSHVHSLNFENSYVRVENQDQANGFPVGTVAGVADLGGTYSSEVLVNVKIKNGTVIGAVAGGFVGQVYAGEYFMQFTDLKADGLKVYLTNDVFSNPESPELWENFAALGGFVGNYDASFSYFNEGENSSADKVSYVEIKNLDVQNKVANIGVRDMPDPVTAYVGGLFGVGTLGNYDLVDNFILQGDLAAASSNDAVGYLAGGLSLPSGYGNYIKTGYYYGKSAGGKSLAGKLFADGGFVDDVDAYLIENSSASYVYRNAVGGLETTGNIRQDGMIVDPSTGEEVRSFGVLSESDMKSGTFAFALDQYNNQWTWGESLAEGLPEFASGENLPIRRVTLSVNPNVSSLLPSSVKEALLAHGEEFDGSIQISFYTDNTGKISDSFAKTIESIPGFAWFSGDGDFNASQLFEEAGWFYLNVDKPVVVAPRVLKVDASDIWTEADLLKIESNAVGELTGYFGLVPDMEANIYNEGTGDVYTLQNFTEPVVYYANESGVQNWGLMYVAMKVDDEIKYALIGEGSLKDALSRSILSGADGSTVGDTLYLVYSQNGARDKVTFYGDGYEKVQYFGYEAGNLKKVVPIGPATVLTSTEAYENGLAHAYKFEGNPDAGYHVDRLDITIEFLSHYGASSSSFATEGYASDGDLFGSVHDLKKKLKAAGGGTWYFSLFTTDTLVMDSLFAVYDYFKASGENPIMKISVQANPEANYYEIEFATFTEKKPFYAEEWYDYYGSWKGNPYLSVMDDFTYPAMYMIGEDGEYHYYNEWSLGKGDDLGTAFSVDGISYFRTDTVNVMYPQYDAGYDIYSTTVKLYRDETGAFADDRASLELWQIVGPWDMLDTVSHEFTAAEDGSGDRVIEVPLIDGGSIDFTIGIKPHGDYIIDSVRVLREVNDGSGTYEEDGVLRKGEMLTVGQGVNLALAPAFRENRTYHVAYDLKLEGDVIPYVSVYDIIQKSFRTEDEVMALPRIYRTDACHSGWLYDGYEAPELHDAVDVLKIPAEDVAEGAPSDSPMEGLIELNYVLMEAVAPNDSIEVYALWYPPADDGYGDCYLDNKKVYYLDDSVATVTLTQTILGVDYVTKLNSEGTAIPNVDGGLAFVLNVHPYEGYVVDDSVTMVMMDERESKGERPRKYAVGDTIVLPGWGGDISFTGGFKKAEEVPEKPMLLPQFSDSTELVISGNAYQFRYAIENCGEEQEVRFDMALMAEGDTDKVEMTLAAEESCSGVIEDYPLLSGSYTFKAEVYVEGHKDSASVFTQTFTVESVIASAGVDSWQMLGLDAVETDSVVMDDDVRFFWWNESKSYGEFWQYYSLTDLTQFERGRGYWYSSLEGRTLPLKDSIEIPKDGFKLAWSLDSLYSGWNLVSNPFGWEISLGVSDDDEVTFWRWNAETSEYERATTVRPYEALWAKVAKHVDWTLDTKPVFVAQDSVQDSLQKSLSKATTEKEWSIRAVLSDHNGKRDSWNVLGVGARNVAWEEPPAGMGNHVNLSIMDGKRSLAKSVKMANASKVTAADNAYEWQVELSATTARMGYLSFEGLESISKFGYRVFVTVDGFTQEVTAGSAMEVPLTSLAKTATIRVAAEPRKTLTYALGGLRMVQSGNFLNVTFMASDGLAGSGLTVEVLDLRGKVVARTTGNALSGANFATLAAPAGGLYMLRVRAGSAQTAGKIVVK